MGSTSRNSWKHVLLPTPCSSKDQLKRKATSSRMTTAGIGTQGNPRERACAHGTSPSFLRLCPAHHSRQTSLLPCTGRVQSMWPAKMSEARRPLKAQGGRIRTVRSTRPQNSLKPLLCIERHFKVFLNRHLSPSTVCTGAGISGGGSRILSSNHACAWWCCGRSL